MTKVLCIINVLMKKEPCLKFCAVANKFNLGFFFPQILPPSKRTGLKLVTNLVMFSIP